MSSSPPLKIETLPPAWIGCKITTFIWNMQIKFYNLLKLALIYTFFVNLYPLPRKKKKGLEAKGLEAKGGRLEAKGERGKEKPDTQMDNRLFLESEVLGGPRVLVS